METLYSVILLAIASILSSMIYTKLPKIPLAFYQVLSGLILAIFPMFHNYTLSSELFISAVIAPLLYNDGQNTNHKQLQYSIKQIISMSVGLAIFTAIILGYVAHLIFPIIPIMLTLALAAIITPTDSVALTSITDNLKIPYNIKSNLQNESLFNDASGIVIFDLALNGFITGQVSLFSGFEHFLISFLGGLIIGTIFGFIAIIAREWMVSQSMDSISVIIPFSLLTPIAIYSIAIFLHSSGILAVVAAGIVQGINKHRMRLTAADVQLTSKSSWTILTNLLNGFSFVLLGVILPTVLKGVFYHPKLLTIELLLLAVVMYLIMFAIRFIWVSLKLAKSKYNSSTSIKDAFITAISGIHGTITLSMALSIPLTYQGHEFPYRNEIIFVASVIILISLFLPTIILPLILPKKTTSSDADYIKHRNQMVNYGISRLKEYNKAPLIDLDFVIDMLNSQKIKRQPNNQQIRLFFRQTINIERSTLKELVRNHRITNRDAEIIAQRASKINNMSFNNRVLFWFKVHLPKNRQALSTANDFVQKYSQMNDIPRMVNRKKETFKSVENQIYENIIRYLDQIETNDNQAAIAYVRRFYNIRHNQSSLSQVSIENRNRLFIHAFKYEFNYVLHEYTNNRISQDMANRLNHSISTDQLVYMQSIDD
ncbi:cation:proton antiporter [Lentilactobacillus laojiaonis]|uniref:cation:proton antiporter n=1 Tax=Lentilactobacillus laojiaonis TaxID=2883998 RepID=UPI001D0B09B3|nr:sodium:proton antiporter [Lentilactobacillus laojiaonis]UDM32089.1 sodium:proton antiporter [Lentilactobacillus laojiaonis]